MKNKIDRAVDTYFKNNEINSNDLSHVKDIAKSILYDKFNVMHGGGFVKAFNLNNLLMTFQKADLTILDAIPYLVKMTQNIEIK